MMYFVETSGLLIVAVILLPVAVKLSARSWYEEKLQFLKRQLAEARLADDTDSTFKRKGVH